MKRKKWLAGLMTLVVVVTMTLNLAPTALANGGDEPSLGFKEHRDWYYTDEELNIELDKSGLEETDYESIEWRFGYWNEEKQDGDTFNYEYSSEDRLYLSASDVASLRNTLLKVSGGSETLILRAVAVKDGQEIASTDNIGIELREPFCEYYYPVNSEGEIEIVAGWNYQINANMGARIENGENPEGRDASAKVTNIVSSDPSAVSVAYSELGDCYYLEAGTQAWDKSATITIMHEDLLNSGKTISYDITVNVVDTVTNLNVWSSKTTNQVLPGETVELYADAVQEWDGGSISFPGELEEEAILEWSTKQEGVTIDVNAEISSQCEVIVREELLGQDAVVTATLYQKNSDGTKGDKLASQNYSLYVTDEYYEIVLKYSSDDKNFDTLYPGESCKVTPILLHYSSQQEEPEPIGEVDWSWQSDDEEVLSVSEPEDEDVYTISRHTADGVNLNLQAFVEGAKKAEAGWWFNDVYGEVWFENEDYRMYTDKDENDPYTILLNTEQLGDMEYEVTYQLIAAETLVDEDKIKTT